MTDSYPHEIVFSLSSKVNKRLQQFMKATGLDASAVVDHSLDLFFEGLPDAAIVEKLRILNAADKTPPLN